MHSGAARSVQQPKLDARSIGGDAHYAIERINFANKMAFPNAANGGIAGHLADPAQVVGDKRDASAHPCRRMGSLDTGVTASDHNDVRLTILFHVKHYPVMWRHFPMQSCENIRPNTSSQSIRPIILSSAMAPRRTSSAQSSTSSADRVARSRCASASSSITR